MALSHPVTPPAEISQEAAKLLYLALNDLVAVVREGEHTAADDALDSADIALDKANGVTR